MARIDTKVGDVFSAKVNDHSKKYFQYIGNDLTQLNSDVIRAFERVYPVSATPDLTEIVGDKVAFYAHCVVKLGLKMKLWEKVGHVVEVGDIKNILFRDTSDYGTKIGEPPITISHNWYVWRVNDKNVTQVGKLDDESRKSEIGLVINPLGIIELLKGNKYPINYPKFE